MEGVATPSDVGAVWAALQHEPRAESAASRSFRLDDDDEDEEDEDDSMEDDEAAPVMPQRVGGGLLPSTFYATSGLPDVVPAFLLTNKPPFGESTAASSSELFLDEILRSHDDSLAAHLAANGQGAGDVGNTRLTAERLSQLEDNYERKKKRAKINRRDLNSRFQELMDLLQLKEDRKLNRAKVLEKAIEQIQKLTDELKLAKLQLSQRGQNPLALPPPGFAAAAASFNGGARGPPPMQMPMPLPQWTPGAAGVMPPSALNMASPMMWMPMMPSQQRGAATRPASARTKATKTTRAVATTTRTVSMQTQTSPEKPSRAERSVRRPGLKRGRECETTTTTTTTTMTSASLAWVAQEIPALLELCDAWTLSQLMGTSHDLRTAACRDSLWQRLCERRWHLGGPETPARAVAANDSLSMWKQLHAANEMPRCVCVTGTTLHFAAGRVGAVGLWASLVRRSNGRTTRTVLVDGKAVVRQVVELNVLVQNLHTSASLRLTDQLRVVASGSSSPSGFQLITSDSRAHLMPHLVTVNDVPSGSTNVDAVELFHNDFCVLSVFVECDGLDLEQQFLERVDGVTMACELWSRGHVTRIVQVAAHATERKRALLAEVYGDKSV